MFLSSLTVVSKWWLCVYVSTVFAFSSKPSGQPISRHGGERLGCTSNDGLQRLQETLLPRLISSLPSSRRFKNLLHSVCRSSSYLSFLSALQRGLRSELTGVDAMNSTQASPHARLGVLYSYLYRDVRRQAYMYVDLYT